MRLRSLFTLGVVALVVLGLASNASAGRRKPPPVGWEGLRWGMGWQDVEKIHPDLEPYGDPSGHMSKPVEAEVTLPIQIDTFVLEDRSFGPIEGCQARLDFLNARLWQIRFKCKGTDPDKIHGVLVNRYGFPLPGRGHHLVWKEQWTHIGFNPNSGQFVLADRQRGKKLSTELYGTLLRSQLLAGQDGAEEASETETPEGSELSPGAQAGAAPSEATPPEEAPEASPDEAPPER